MFKKFIRYVLPSALSMFISSLYAIIDGIFVGKGIGDSALAAVNIVVPLTIFFFGIASMFAIGGGTLISENFGKNDITKGIEIFREVFKFLLIISFALSFICIIFAKNIVIFLGAEGDLIPLATIYLKYYSVFCIPNIIGIALSSFIRNDGNPTLAMIAMIVGAIINIIFDYYFIFKLNLGIRGAAIATGIGQCFTVILILVHFYLKKGNLSFGKCRLNRRNIYNFISLGFPSFFTEITFSITIFLINIALLKIKNNNIMASFGIINYITTNIYMLLLGLSFGAQPLFSFYFAARKQIEVSYFYKMSFLSSIFINGISFLFFYFYGEIIIRLFTNNTDIINTAYKGLILFNLSFFIMGLNIIQSGYYQAIGRPLYSNIICFFRSIIFLPITILIFAKYFGLKGIWISVFFSELFSYIVWNTYIIIKRNYFYRLKNIIK